MPSKLAHGHVTVVVGLDDDWMAPDEGTVRQSERNMQQSGLGRLINPRVVHVLPVPMLAKRARHAHISFAFPTTSLGDGVHLNCSCSH